MTYSKPILRALDLHVDAASCKPAPPPEPVCRGTEIVHPTTGQTICIDPRTQPGCPGLHVSNLCFASKTIVYNYAYGNPTGVSVGSPLVESLLP